MVLREHAFSTPPKPVFVRWACRVVQTYLGPLELHEAAPPEEHDGGPQILGSPFQRMTIRSASTRRAVVFVEYDARGPGIYVYRFIAATFTIVRRGDRWYVTRTAFIAT